MVLPPSGRFTHLTAAALLGLWLPPLLDHLPVFAAMSDAEPRPQRAGLRITRHTSVPEPVVVDGLRLDPPAHILLACARHLGVVDLVVLIDSALHLQLCTRADIASVAGLRRRGSPRLRKALALADGRSESAWETMLRLLHVTCGIDVEPQFQLQDEDGAFVARADLWIRGTNAVHEYDGGDHLSRPQQRKDLARARRIGNRTWLRRGYTSAEVLHQAAGVLRDVDLSLGREHNPERVRAWHRLLADSLFTGSGRERFRASLGLLSPETGARLRGRGA